jgi:nucleoside-diphosphate-sugar epimerase
VLVALTGATGFLVRGTLAALHGHGHAARALSRRNEPVAALEGLVNEWCFGDQYDPAVQARLVANVSAVIHVAMDWKALNDSPRVNVERNLAGTLQLLEAARAARVPQFVFVSSLDVYGNAAGERRLTEMDLPLPNSIYGAFKAAVELHLCAYRAAFGMNTSSWRPAAMYGIKPGIESSLWHDVLRRVRGGETVTEPTAADIVSVDDVSDALALAIGDETVAGQIFNLVDVRLDWQTVAEIARRMIQKTDGSPYAGLSALESRFDSRKGIHFFDRHGRHEALRRGLAGAASYLAGLLSADSTL